MADSDSVDNAPSSSMPLADPKILEWLVCPVTKGPLRYDPLAQELISEKAGLAYPIHNGVPIMLVDEARSWSRDTVIDPIVER